VAWTNRGNALADLGRPDEAIGAFDKAVGLDPGYEKAWYNKGVLLLGQGKFKEALGCFDEALDLVPHDERALRARESCYRAMGVAGAEG
jgi:tetratricopeptide (TPR) repeat protein